MCPTKLITMKIPSVRSREVFFVIVFTALARLTLVAGAAFFDPVLPTSGRVGRLSRCLLKGFSHHRSLPKGTRGDSVSVFFALQAKSRSSNESEEEDEGIGEPGMADAFRRLEALESLGDDENSDKDDGTAAEKAPFARKGLKGFDSQAAADAVASTAETSPKKEKASPEKEVEMYSAMVRELEETGGDEAGLYEDVLEELGGNGTSVSSSSFHDTSKYSTPSILEDSSTPQQSSSSQADTEKFMNQALQEALDEVELNKPSSVDSVLNDKELMAEIEQIFEKGNEKLLQSLEDIRQEQQALAAASAAKSADQAVDRQQQENTARLAAAESSMERQLQNVNKETAAVEKAVQDLQRAQSAIDSQGGASGGLVKAGALAGTLLFAVRSMLDTLAAVNGNDGDLLQLALIQGGIALICAVVFVVVS